MTFLTTWEDFEKAAERLYLQDPMKVSIETGKKKLINRLHVFVETSLNPKNLINMNL